MPHPAPRGQSSVSTKYTHGPAANTKLAVPIAFAFVRETVSMLGSTKLGVNRHAGVGVKWVG